MSVGCSSGTWVNSYRFYYRISLLQPFHLLTRWEMKILMHVCTPHTGLIDALRCTGAVCDGQPAGGWVYLRLPPALSLYSHIFSSVESRSSLWLPCMSEYLKLGTKEAGRLFSPADDFSVLHRLAGLTHFGSSLQLEVTCGGEPLSVSASGKVGHYFVSKGWFFCHLFNFVRHSFNLVHLWLYSNV